MKNNFMNEAILEAYKALEIGEVPIGAVIVKDECIIGRGHNLVESLNLATAHAEIMAINDASRNLKNWRLAGCDMYVTLEPCPMCAGAIIQSRIKNLYIGTFDPRFGACGSVINVAQNDNLGHIVDVHWSYNKECSQIITEFFKARR